MESDCYVRTQIGTVRLHKLPEGQSCARLAHHSHISSALHSWTCPKNTSTPTWKPSSLTSAPIGRPTWVRLPKLTCHCCIKSLDISFNEQICSMTGFPCVHLLGEVCCADLLYFSRFHCFWRVRLCYSTQQPLNTTLLTPHQDCAVLATNGPPFFMGGDENCGQSESQKEKLSISIMYPLLIRHLLSLISAAVLPRTINYTADL